MKMQWMVPVLAAAVATSFAARPAPPGGGAPSAPAATPPSTRPATRPTATGNNKAAAVEHFNKAKDLLYKDNNPRAAFAENEQALRLDPTNYDVQLLKRVIQSKIEDNENGGEETAAAGTAGGKVKTLTPQQISVIKLLESTPSDQLRGRIQRSTLQDFWDSVVLKDQAADKSRQAYEAFMNPLNFSAQVAQIRDYGNNKYIEQVTIFGDPSLLVPFKNTIQTYMLQNCATAECHASDKAGRFRLINGSNNDANMYTNFYIMSMYTSKLGGKMIDRDNPDHSLFLQYGLPRNVAQFAHPKIEIRKFGNTQDTRFRTMSDWVKSLNIPRPNYGIAYDMPGGAETAPAAAPATTRASRGR